MLKAMECNTTRLEALEQRISALEKIINDRFDALLEFLNERIPESLKLSASSAPLEIASPREPDEKRLTQESKSKFHDMVVPSFILFYVIFLANHYPILSLFLLEYRITWCTDTRQPTDPIYHFMSYLFSHSIIT